MNTSTMTTSNLEKEYSDPSGSAGNTVCTIVIWIRSESLSYQLRRQALIRFLESLPGIKAARFSTTGPLLLIVEYLTEHTQALSVVQSVESLGLEARLVGC